MLALLGAHQILRLSGVRVKILSSHIIFFFASLSKFQYLLFSLRSSSSCFRFSLLHIPSTLSPVMRCRPSGLQTTFISYGLSHRRHSHLRHYFNSGPRDSSFSDSYFLGLSRMAQTLFPICKVSLPFLSSHSLTLFRAYIFYFNIDLES